MIFEVLSQIGQKLDEAGILWGVGASILLNHYGIIDKPNDIDVMIDLKDIEKADIILKHIGEKKIREESQTYSTKYFYEYVVNGIDVDVMSGLTINHSKGAYRYIFDKDSISQTVKINGIDIPLTYLEDWYVIYQLIPNKEFKAEMIEDYILSNGIKKAILLERALTKELPDEVRKKIENILKFH